MFVDRPSGRQSPGGNSHHATRVTPARSGASVRRISCRKYDGAPAITPEPRRVNPSRVGDVTHAAGSERHPVREGQRPCPTS
jgi:hypothetical protein